MRSLPPTGNIRKTHHLLRFLTCICIQEDQIMLRTEKSSNIDFLNVKCQITKNVNIISISLLIFRRDFYLDLKLGIRCSNCQNKKRTSETLGAVIYNTAIYNTPPILILSISFHTSVPSSASSHNGSRRLCGSHSSPLENHARHFLRWATRQSLATPADLSLLRTSVYL